MRTEKFDVKKLKELLTHFENKWDSNPDLLDIIYLVGVSIDDKYKWASGFDFFKEDLKKVL